MQGATSPVARTFQISVSQDAVPKLALSEAAAIAVGPDRGTAAPGRVGMGIRTCQHELWRPPRLVEPPTLYLAQAPASFAWPSPPVLPIMLR